MKKESDMYIPVKKYFQKQGYEIHGEVLDCDMTATKDDELIIIEFKLSFNVTLIFQGIDRQKYTNLVYLCIPKPEGKRLVGYRKLQKIKKVCTPLGFGLITYDVKNKEIIVHNKPNFKEPTKKFYFDKIMKEINGRTMDLNTGGTTGVKINTAYKELRFTLIFLLERDGMSTAKVLRNKYDLPNNTYRVLRNNIGEFFTKESERGYFSVSKIGKNELRKSENKTLYEIIKEKYSFK
ncbi:MAG: DUF2161 family putative PD-(D/E)XK-type phosphodiesterase [Lachnospirales bacterium]